MDDVRDFYFLCRVVPNILMHKPGCRRLMSKHPSLLPNPDEVEEFIPRTWSDPPGSLGSVIDAKDMGAGQKTSHNAQVHAWTW